MSVELPRLPGGLPGAPRGGGDAIAGAQVPTAVVRLRLIGQMDAWTLTTDRILPTGRKTRALLAVLALSHPRRVLRSKLAELLWSRRSDEQARASLRQEIHRLLEAMHPVGAQILLIHRDHLGLKPGSVWIDVEEVLRATPSQPDALTLLDAELVEDLMGLDPSFDAWLSGERERVRDKARALAEQVLTERDQPDGLIAAAQQLLAIDRTHEGAWRTLMRAYALRGERGMAIQAFERCRLALGEYLDATPSEETQSLLAEIRAAGGEAPPPPADTTAERRPALRPEVRPPSSAESRPELRLEPRGTGRGGTRIGVLPLQVIGGRHDDDYLSTALADEITTALSRFRGMFVVSSASLARFAVQTREESAIRRSFGLDLVMDGTLQRGADRLRVTLRLIDLRDGNQVVWSRRFDRVGNDLLSLQDEVAASVVAQLDSDLMMAEAERAATRPLSDATAYDLVLRAMPLIVRLDREGFLEAGDYLARAIQQEPDFAPAHAWRGFWYILLVGQGWAANTEAAMEDAGLHAERAIQLDPQDARAYAIAGHVRAFLQRRPHEALALHERALALNPNLSMAWAFSAGTYTYLGNIDEAERRVRHYKQLSPLDPHAFLYDTTFTMVALLKGEYEAAVISGREVSQLNAGYSAVLRPYLAALGHLGWAEEAAQVRGRLLAIEPRFSLRAWVARSLFERPQDMAAFTEGLRRAGVPE